MFPGTLKAENMYKKNINLVFRTIFIFATESQDLAQDAYYSEIIQCIPVKSAHNARFLPRISSPQLTGASCMPSYVGLLKNYEK